MSTQSENSRPIIFSSKMVKKILSGEKTQTRRVVKQQPLFEPSNTQIIIGSSHRPSIGNWLFYDDKNVHDVKCPYGKIGDTLWVRETWAKFAGIESKVAYAYRADGTSATLAKEHLSGNKWQSPLFMPRTASRINLEIADIRVERLQDISSRDIEAEGVSFPTTKTIGENKTAAETWTDEFMFLWDSINAKRGFSWQSNPFVWVVEFKRI